MKHYLAFSIAMMISLLMACCLTSAIQRMAPNLASQAQTAVVTQAEGLGQKMAETLLPSMSVSTLEAQAQTMVATALAGAGQQLENTPQAPGANSGGQAPAGVPADFPVTQDAASLKVLATGDQAQINYQTKMSLTDVMSFCTVQLTSAGWHSRPELLSMTSTTFSIVFASSSKPTDIVIQGVTVGDLTNVNVRYEAVK
jgi:hypothetical protein